jgi:hypothetical protein
MGTGRPSEPMIARCKRHPTNMLQQANAELRQAQITRERQTLGRRASTTMWWSPVSRLLRVRRKEKGVIEACLLVKYRNAFFPTNVLCQFEVSQLQLTSPRV